MPDDKHVEGHDLDEARRVDGHGRPRHDRAERLAEQLERQHEGLQVGVEVELAQRVKVRVDEAAVEVRGGERPRVS